MKNGSVVWRRQLGRSLRLLREEAGMTLDDAAPALDWSVSKLSRIENGQQSVDVHGVRSMLDLYDVGGPQWTELLALARETRQRGWWRAYGMGDDSYVGFEAWACQVRELALTHFPGLLQTAAYSRALFEAAPVDRNEDELRKAVEVRTIRQRRLTAAEDPLELVAVIDEQALHRPIGGPAVLRDQLHHLLRMSALPSVTIQILPTALGAHAGISSGFIVLSFGDLGEPDLAYVEHSLGAINIQKANDVSRAKLVFDRLRALTLSQADSVDLIKEVAGGY